MVGWGKVSCEEPWEEQRDKKIIRSREGVGELGAKERKSSRKESS